MKHTLLVISLIMCFFSHDLESVTHRICFYECLDSLTAITIPLTQICPLSIEGDLL